jgi:hypothetical protein
MRWLPAWLAFLGFAVAASPAWADCPLDLGHGTGWVVFSQQYMIAFRPDPPHFETGEPVALILNVCTKNGDAAQLVGIDVHFLDESGAAATDTEHLAIVPGVDGRYRAEGLLLKKPGRWEVTFDVRSGKDSERLSHEIEVH